MWRRKMAGEQKGSKWRKLSRETRSLRLFWMGVPVKHQRRSELSAAAALN